jgi:hypothetical protein
VQTESFSVEILKEKGILGDLDVDGRIILNKILRK